uniref:hypothetical protein n=1 Tax=Fulvivirga sp. TaxID=1931237 RepID=UPI004048FDBB
MSYLIETLKFIAPFLGIFVGWFLAKRSEAARIKYEEIKHLKKSLYVLLEIRNLIHLPKRLDGFLNLLNLNLSNSFGSASDQIDSQIFKNLIETIIPSLIGTNTHIDLKEQFKKSIDNLSEIDPLLAYRINGKQNIQDYLKSWEKESQSLFESQSIEEIQDIINHFKPIIVDEISRDIDLLIIEIAGSISSIKEEEVISIVTERTDSEIDEEIKRLLNKIFAPT